MGEGERLRFVVGAFAESEEEVVAEVEDRLVFTVEVACSVALESLDVGLRGAFDFFVVGVCFGGLEKSSSEDSLSEELVSEDEDDRDAAFSVAVACLGSSVADSLSDDDVSGDEDKSAEDLGRATLAGVSDVVVADFLLVLAFAFFTGEGFASLVEDSSDSDSESELDVPLELAFRFKLLTTPFTIDFCDAASVGSCAPAGSSSSSASLSELELEVDGDGDFAFDAFLLFFVVFVAVAASSISTSDSLSSPPLSLLPLVLVSSFALTLAAASSLALAPALACFFAFFELLTSFVSELSSESLPLLVSSNFVVSLYVLYHSL